MKIYIVEQSLKIIWSRLWRGHLSRLIHGVNRNQNKDECIQSDSDHLVGEWNEIELLFCLEWFAGIDSENNSNASTNDSSASNGITIEGVSSVETSPSTRQYSAVTQSSIIKRKGSLKPESAEIEVNY